MSIFPKVERRFLAVLFRVASTIAYSVFDGLARGAKELDKIDDQDRKHKASQEGGGK